jgi:hypothetical protein
MSTDILKNPWILGAGGEALVLVLVMETLLLGRSGGQANDVKTPLLGRSD